jgi:hypothetical protein
MLPELSIERIFRREIDSLPLPPENSWVPTRLPARRSTPLTALVVSATFVLVLGAVLTVREAGDAATSRGGRTTGPLQNLPRPSCLRADCNVYRSEGFGYGIVLPADWRVAPPLYGRTPPTGQLERVDFTRRTPDEWTLAVERDTVVPWDLVVEVHERRGVLAMDWARADGCGASQCVVGETTLSQLPAYTASWPLAAPSVQMHAYYLERGDRMLILRYVTGPETVGPHGVIERTLQQIVDSIALG